MRVAEVEDDETVHVGVDIHAYAGHRDFKWTGISEFGERRGAL